jgi:cell division protease FtsH
MFDNNKDKDKEKKPDKPFWKQPKNYILIGLLVVVIIFLALAKADSVGTVGSLKYNEFFRDLENGYIEEVHYAIGSPFVEVHYKEGMCQEGIIDENTGELRELEIVDNQRIETVLNPNDEEFFKKISEADVDVKILSENSTAFISIIAGLIPTIILMCLIIWMVKMQFGGGSKDPTAQKAVKSTTKFSDVAGMTEEKEELMFAIKSLQHTEEYLEKGVKPVRGILLEGPPGVGKTLLAKAVAGEAGVNFLSYSGADFVEMFVGLGARRVRSMYEEAEKKKPCVVFIDEIDALGRKRAVGGNPGNQEADQTLIALLEKMDGMNTTSGILFIAATNRVDALDSALLRPGRFDKTIHVSPPKSKEDREAVVAVHSKDKTFEDGVTVEKIAKQCYGLTGAEIASALNDAVLESFKADRNGIISLGDIDKAIMKLFAKGLAKGKHNEKDLFRVAVHEVGHALMNRELGRNVVKVSIQPYSSGVGGVTQVDGESSGLDGLMTKTDIINSVKVLYAGKAAEEAILGECSVGASNDLERATYIIRDYIGAYGMNGDNLLSLVGLGRENMLITSNEKLLEEMGKVANDIYKEVQEYFSREDVKVKVNEISNILCENEVIYDFEAVYNGEKDEGSIEKNLEILVKKPVKIEVEENA